jgi:hypothetical protein
MSLDGHRAALPAFSCFDGRIYDVTNVTVEKGRPGGYEFRCTIETLERHGQYCLDYMFNFYPAAFERGLCEPEPKQMVKYASDWIQEWLDDHPEAHSFFDAGRPLIVDCR